MTEFDADIPIVETYRGVGIHDKQDEARRKVVRADIDAVFAISRNRAALLAWIEDRRTAPESRLLARAFILAEVEEHKSARRAAPDVDVDRVNAMTVALGKQRCRSRTHYDSFYLPRPAPGSWNRPVERTSPLS